MWFGLCEGILDKLLQNHTTQYWCGILFTEENIYLVEVSAIKMLTKPFVCHRFAEQKKHAAFRVSVFFWTISLLPLALEVQSTSERCARQRNGASRCQNANVVFNDSNLWKHVMNIVWTYRTSKSIETSTSYVCLVEKVLTVTVIYVNMGCQKITAIDTLFIMNGSLWLLTWPAA